MRPGLPSRAWIALLLALPSALVLAAGSVYRWTDAQGVVHYDDQSRLQQRLTRETIARKPVPAEPSATVPNELVQAVRQRCVDLRERAASVRGAAQLYGTDPAGNRYPLSPRQAALARAEADREEARYCAEDAPRRLYREALAEGRREQAEADMRAELDQTLADHR